MRGFTLFLNGLALFGVDPRATLRSCRGLPFFVRDYLTFKRQSRISRYSEVFPMGLPLPCLSDRFAESGETKGAYFHQDLHVAQRIFLNKPQDHVDVGSRIDGFVAHVASFRAIKVIDIRPLPDTIKNVSFMQADMMEPIPPHLEACTDSLSCLHAAEHFGLGRYGDPVRYDGHLRGIDNLYRLLKTGGRLYFSVPIGKQRVEFNGHRIFSVRHLLDLFKGRYRLDAFSYIDDASVLHENVTLSDELADNNFGCFRGCGIFELTKI